MQRLELAKQYEYFRGVFRMKYKKYNLQDVYDGEAQNKFNVISTFAGGGGASVQQITYEKKT